MTDNLDLTNYKNAGFDALWYLDTDNWVAGFLCQGNESLLNDGLVCFMPYKGEPYELRNGALSPICTTAQEAIDQSYNLYKSYSGRAQASSERVVK